MQDPQSAVVAVIAEKISSGAELGLQVAAYFNGELIVDAWGGLAEAGTDRAVAESTMFTMFSCSKGVTSTALHTLAERGALDYDDPIAKYWPEFGQFGKSAITIRHVLTHMAGLPDVPIGIDVTDWDRMCWAITQLDPQFLPGTETAYSGLTFGWLIGEVVRRVDGRTLAEVLAQDVCAPAAIPDLYLGVPDSELDRIAVLQNGVSMIDGPYANYATRYFAPRFNERDVHQASIPAGGIIGTARSLARMYAALIGDGVDGVRILPADRVAVATTLQTEATDRTLGRPIRKALGYVLGEPGSIMGTRPNAFGHTGHGGSIGFADPDCGLSFALAKNRLILDVQPGEGTAYELVRAVRVALGIAESS